MQETDSIQNQKKLGKGLMNLSAILFVFFIVFNPALIGIPIMVFIIGLVFQFGVSGVSNTQVPVVKAVVPGMAIPNSGMPGFIPSKIEPNTVFSGVKLNLYKMELM